MSPKLFKIHLWKDDRAETSWTAKLGDISWVESLEVQVINATRLVLDWSAKCQGDGALCAAKQAEALSPPQGERPTCLVLEPYVVQDPALPVTLRSGGWAKSLEIS